MQNSGLPNALSPLTSLNYTFRIPFLAFVSLRGERDANNKNTDEPQHELLGIITEKLLETCEISYAFLSHDLGKAIAQLQEAKNILAAGKCFFFIVRNDVFEKVALGKSRTQTMKNKHPQSHCPKNNAATSFRIPTRLEALRAIQDSAKNFALIATTGKCARELYELGDKPNQLYMVGSMGCVSALALGVALKSDKKIVAIDGDSALLMRLGTLSNNAYYSNIANKGNLCHILLDNHSHDSTGGQDNLAPFIDFGAVAKHCGYGHIFVAQTLGDLQEILQLFNNATSGGAWFVYIRIAKGSKDNLSRPKIAPHEVAARFSAWLNAPIKQNLK